MIFLWILSATLVVSAISLVGIVLFLFKRDIHHLSFYLISLASGTMLGGAFLHLIPEALEHHLSSTMPLIATGVFIFFILEKLLIWRHCHDHQHSHDFSRPNAAKMMLVGDAVHNFIDGIIIASAFLSNVSLGISVTLAIVFHEIPQELGDSAVLIHAGFNKKQVIIANGLTATTSILGAVLTYFFLHAIPLLQPHLLAITAGGFLYIALADLIPQLHEQVAIEHALIQMALLAGGFLVMFFIKSHVA